MGGHWGIFDSSGRAKFPWRGPVSAASGVWPPVLLAGALGAGLALLLALAFPAAPLLTTSTTLSISRP